MYSKTRRGKGVLILNPSVKFLRMLYYNIIYMVNNYIVTLTTIPSKFDNLHLTIDSIINQTMLPSKIIINIPKTYKPSPSCQALLANPILVKLKAYSIVEKGRMRWLPKRVTNFPEKNIIVNCPNGKANKIVPNVPSLRCKSVLICGIRLAQVAKLKPIPK